MTIENINYIEKVKEEILNGEINQDKIKIAYEFAFGTIEYPVSLVNMKRLLNYFEVPKAILIEEKKELIKEVKAVVNLKKRKSNDKIEKAKTK